ncbi:Hypothetical protein SCF082_LOCUS4289 [Durusdinium trenchii]|uniref:Uncharacterized protein n=1 Tax=Durusdinium trenchii TaxID=1381693 RepID=A0ABP0I148_9DINO
MLPSTRATRCWFGSCCGAWACGTGPPWPRASLQRIRFTSRTSSTWWAADVTTDPLGESFTRPARHVKGLVCSATGAISLAVLALTSFILLAVARFAVTQGSSAVFGYVDTPVQYHESFWVRSWSYLFQHSYYGKLLIFPGDLSWDGNLAVPVLVGGTKETCGSRIKPPFGDLVKGLYQNDLYLFLDWTRQSLGPS